MANTVTPPNDSSNRTLQDRYNQEVAAVIATLRQEIEELKSRVTILENT